MLSAECLRELRSAWLPNLTDAGLARLLNLLEKGSPFLVSGCFVRSIPMGCLASHAAWNHPETEHLNLEAGVTWLHGVGGRTPPTSLVWREGDSRAPCARALRSAPAAKSRDELPPRNPPPPRRARPALTS